MSNEVFIEIFKTYFIVYFVSMFFGFVIWTFLTGLTTIKPEVDEK